MALAGHLIVRLVWIAVGLSMACLAAGLFLGLGYYNTLVAHDLAPPELAARGIYSFAAALALAPFIAVPAFGPALILIAAAEIMRFRGLVANMALGAAASVLVFSIPAGIGALGNMDIDALMVLLSCGFIGGAAYWLVAGRNAGVWLDARRARSAES